MQFALHLLERHRLGRKRMTDTLLASTLLRHGVNSIMTCNPSDFALFTDLEVIDPRNANEPRGLGRHRQVSCPRKERSPSRDSCESPPALEFELGRSRPEAAATRTLALLRLQHGSVQPYPVWRSNPHVSEDNGF